MERKLADSSYQRTVCGFQPALRMSSGIPTKALQALRKIRLDQYQEPVWKLNSDENGLHLSIFWPEREHGSTNIDSQLIHVKQERVESTSEEQRPSSSSPVSLASNPIEAILNALTNGPSSPKDTIFEAPSPKKQRKSTLNLAPPPSPLASLNMTEAIANSNSLFGGIISNSQQTFGSRSYGNTYRAGPSSIPPPPLFHNSNANRPEPTPAANLLETLQKLYPQQPSIPEQTSHAGMAENSFSKPTKLGSKSMNSFDPESFSTMLTNLAKGNKQNTVANPPFRYKTPPATSMKRPMRAKSPLTKTSTRKNQTTKQFLYPRTPTSSAPLSPLLQSISALHSSQSTSTKKSTGLPIKGRRTVAISPQYKNLLAMKKLRQQKAQKSAKQDAKFRPSKCLTQQVRVKRVTFARIEEFRQEMSKDAEGTGVAVGECCANIEKLLKIVERRQKKNAAAASPSSSGNSSTPKKTNDPAVKEKTLSPADQLLTMLSSSSTVNVKTEAPSI